MEHICTMDKIKYAIEFNIIFLLLWRNILQNQESKVKDLFVREPDL